MSRFQFSESVQLSIERTDDQIEVRPGGGLAGRLVRIGAAALLSIATLLLLATQGLLTTGNAAGGALFWPIVLGIWEPYFAKVSVTDETSTFRFGPLYFAAFSTEMPLAGLRSVEPVGRLPLLRFRYEAESKFIVVPGSLWFTAGGKSVQTLFADFLAARVPDE